MTAAVIALACLAGFLECASILRSLRRSDDLCRGLVSLNAAAQMAGRADWLGLVNPPVPGRRRSPDVRVVRAPRVLDDMPQH